MVEQEVIGRIQPGIEQNPTVDGSAFVRSGGETFLRRLKNFPEKARHALGLSVNKPALAGAAASFLVLCGYGNAEKPTPPPPTPTPAVSELPGGMPSQVEFKRLVTPTPEPTPPPSPTPTLEPTPTNTPIPTEIPTPKVEIQQPKVISVGGSVETDPANPSVETIKLLFPEGIINGKSPLIPKGDTLSLYLKLNSAKGIGIRECSLSISDLLGIKIINLVSQ